MKLKSVFAAAAATIALATPAFADIVISDGYARSSGMMAKSGAAFMMIENTGDAADHLISATSEIAKRTELHTHIENDEGIMKMVHVEEGFMVPAGGTIHLKRGGKHVMFMGLLEAMEHGGEVTFTLIFRDAGEITVTVPVDLERKPMGGMGDMNHGEGMMHGEGMQQQGSLGDG